MADLLHKAVQIGLKIQAGGAKLVKDFEIEVKKSPEVVLLSLYVFIICELYMLCMYAGRCSEDRSDDFRDPVPHARLRCCHHEVQQNRCLILQ